VRYRFGDKFSDTLVFGIKAGSQKSIGSGLQRIASILKLSIQKTTGVHICELAHDWLRIKENGKRVMIFNGTDHVNLIKKQLTRYFPQANNWFIVVTTRSHKAAEVIFFFPKQPDQNPFLIGPMTE